jgi:hypothetical protein
MKVKSLCVLAALLLPAPVSAGVVLNTITNLFSTSLGGYDVEDTAAPLPHPGVQSFAVGFTPQVSTTITGLQAYMFLDAADSSGSGVTLGLMADLGGFT